MRVLHLLHAALDGIQTRFVFWMIVVEFMSITQHRVIFVIIVEIAERALGTPALDEFPTAFRRFLVILSQREACIVADDIDALFDGRRHQYAALPTDILGIAIGFIRIHQHVARRFDSFWRTMRERVLICPVK